MQIVIFLIILVIMIFAFQDKTKITTKNIALASMLIVISVVLSAFSVSLPILGFDAFHIGFASISLIILGIIIPTNLASISAIIVDMLGLIVSPTSYPFLGFTLNTLLIVMISNVFYKNRDILITKNVKKIVNYLFFMLISVFYLYIFIVDEVTISQETYFLSNNVRILIILVSLAFLIIYNIIYRKYKKKNLNASNLLYFSMFVSFTVYVFVYNILNPIWLNYMYEIPVSLSMFIRFIKALIMIPLNTFIIFEVIKSLESQKLIS